jgi:hypothetical protein
MSAPPPIRDAPPPTELESIQVQMNESQNKVC